MRKKNRKDVVETPEKWTGELVGNMHLESVSVKDLAEELHCTPGYISMILHGRRSPPDGREKLETAYLKILLRRKEDRLHGSDEDDRSTQ